MPLMLTIAYIASPEVGSRPRPERPSGAEILATNRAPPGAWNARLYHAAEAPVKARPRTGASLRPRRDGTGWATVAAFASGPAAPATPPSFIGSLHESHHRVRHLRTRGPGRLHGRRTATRRRHPVRGPERRRAGRRPARQPVRRPALRARGARLSPDARPDRPALRHHGPVRSHPVGRRAERSARDVRDPAAHPLAVGLAVELR